MMLSKCEATKPLWRNYRMFDPDTRSTWSGGIENPKMPVVVETALPDTTAAVHAAPRAHLGERHARPPNGSVLRQLPATATPFNSNNPSVFLHLGGAPALALCRCAINPDEKVRYHETFAYITEASKANWPNDPLPLRTD